MPDVLINKIQVKGHLIPHKSFFCHMSHLSRPFIKIDFETSVAYNVTIICPCNIT
jgi:hypothetical protein